MKNISIFSLLLCLLTLCSCQDLAIEPNVPNVYTSAADNISSTSATLYGYYSSMHVGSSASPLCYFAVSESQSALENYSYVEYGGDSYSVTTYIGDMSETKYSNSDSWFLELSGLSPNTTYYYFFALVHGNSEVISEISNFTTDNTPPTLKRFSIDMDNCYYRNGYVYYDMHARMDNSLVQYANGNECGIYVKSLDGKYKQYIPCEDNGNEFTVTAAVPKNVFNIYISSWVYWANTDEMQYGVYIKKGSSYEILYSENFDGFEYAKYPEIEFTYLKQTSDEDYNKDNYDRVAYYEYNYKVSGALYMNDLIKCYLGNWNVDDYYHTDIADGTFSHSSGVLYSILTARTDYIQIKATLSDYSEIESENSIAFDLYYGSCYIYLHSGAVSLSSAARTSAAIPYASMVASVECETLN